MKIILKSINKEFVVSKLNANKVDKFPFPIQYADFNVLNYFFENNYKCDELSNLFLYPDSTAIYFHLKYFKKKKYEKIISSDLQNSLLSKLDKNKSNIYLLGDTDFILKRVIGNIEKKYSKIKVVGACNGYKFNTNDLVSEININKIDILFVGLGVGRQEKWILENYTKLNVKVIMSVGGWFQYLAENKKRAPLFMRKIYLEWLHKIILEFPRIWKRYLFGIPKFYYRVITKKIVIHLRE